MAARTDVEKHIVQPTHLRDQCRNVHAGAGDEDGVSRSVVTIATDNLEAFQDSIAVAVTKDESTILPVMVLGGAPLPLRRASMEASSSSVMDETTL